MIDQASINLFLADKIALIIGAAGAYIIWLSSRYLVNNLLARMTLKNMQIEYREFTISGEQAEFDAGDFGFFKSRISYLGNDKRIISKTPFIQNAQIVKMNIRISHQTNGGSNGFKETGKN